MSQPSVDEWTTEDVLDWLDGNDLSRYKPLFSTHKIDGRVLLLLTEDDLRNPPVGIKVLGDIKRMCARISQLRVSNNDDFHSNHDDLKQSNRQRTDGRYQNFPEYDDYSSFTTEFADHEHFRQINPLQAEIENAIGNEIVRTFCAVLYAFSVFFLASYTLAVVHDRLPNTSKYPPLPDVFHENVPFMSWSFAYCEYCAGILSFIWWMVIIFHKHRLVIIRRISALSGSIFLLRCLTMYVTSLSVPGTHSGCSPTKHGTFYNRAMRAREILFGMGMSIRGVRTCGDYMFSGHTATVTLLNFFVCEYTPRSWYSLHAFGWVLNIFGIFFILASHEHYSIDVLISFYITSRLFQYYHTLASSVQVRRSDEKRRRIWFPLFWFFEYRTPLVIPNEYEWPFSWMKLKKLFRLQKSEEIKED